MLGQDLHQRAIGEGGVRRRQALVGAPDAAGLGAVETGQGGAENLAPLQLGAKYRAPQRVEDQELDPRDHFGRNAFVGEAGDEGCDAFGKMIVAGVRCVHGGK